MTLVRSKPRLLGLESSTLQLSHCAPFVTEVVTCADPESFVRGGSNFGIFFKFDEEIENINTAISRPSSARQQNTI